MRDTCLEITKKMKTIFGTRLNTVDLASLIYYNVKVHGIHVDVSVLCFGGRERECLKPSFVKTNRLKMLFVASNVQYQKLVLCRKLESANSMKSLVLNVRRNQKQQENVSSKRGCIN